MRGVYAECMNNTIMYKQLHSPLLKFEPPFLYPHLHILKGLAMIFAGQKTPFIILRGKEIYYIFQNK